MKKCRFALAGILCFAVVLSLSALITDNSLVAEAAVSLPGIEQIKRSSDSFNVLEVVPQAGSGSLGWYVDGQEPGAGWASEKLSHLSSRAARVSAAAAYLASLESDDLLDTSPSNNNTKPLWKTGDYTEYAPWEVSGSISEIKALNLLTEETYTNVTGTFAELPFGGEYRADNSYSIHPGGAGGNFDQNIIGLNPVTEAIPDGTHYYYTLQTFSLLPKFEKPNPGDLIYQIVKYADTDGDAVMDDPYDIAINSDYELVPAGEIGSYIPNQLTYLSFTGSMGSTYLTGLNLLEDYYTATYTVSNTFDTEKPQFVAVADGFVQVDEGCGHFDAVTLSYTYVGRGAPGAAYGYSSDGAGSYTVKTKTVFYTGGFSNNNWFLRYAFDWELGETAPRITVRSLPAGSVTDDDVNVADLIVLSGGRGTITTPYAPSSNDLRGEVKTAIQNAVASKTPVIIDNSLRSRTDTNIGQLAAALVAGGAAHSINGNIYCVNTPLASSTFRSEIPGDHTNPGDPFYAVWYEIDYENFLREQNDPNAPQLPETISMAACVRYIINFGGQRVITKKTSIRVLELQPAGGSHLTKTIVSGWTGIPTGNITIDTMSTSAFIGKIDDLVETYDLVYVGSDTGGSSTNYNDNDMDGLVYCNIGDTIVSGYVLTGLLDRDYSSSQTFGRTYEGKYTNFNRIQADTESRTFRYSGNDLTPGKVSELLDFARSGYPVVISDNLMSGTPGVAAFSFIAVLTENNGVLRASAQATEGTIIPADLPRAYQWYRVTAGGDILVSTSTSPNDSTYRPTEAGTYYCNITLSGKTAKSNTAAVTMRPYTVTPSYPSKAKPAKCGDNIGGREYTITVDVTETPGGNYNTFSVRIPDDPDDYDSISYQWYGKNNKNTNSNPFILQGETLPVYVDVYRHYKYYFCRVTINGCDLDSEIIEWDDRGEHQNKHMIFNASVSYSATMDGVTLTASFDPVVGSQSQRRVRWYTAGGSYFYEDNSEPYSVEIDTPGTYYCEARVRINNTNYIAVSNHYTIAEGTDIVLRDDFGPAAFVPAVEAQFNVNTGTVDYCSKMYSFLDSVSECANVFTETGASEKSNTLRQYLNLSKPKIVFSESGGVPCYPTEYTGPDGLSLEGRTLTYKFTIRNDTDVTPADTRYYCNLYIDMNADGRFSYPSEQLADITITDGGGNIIRTGELKAGVEYTASRLLPEQYVGIVPWKLEVVKVGQPHVHASEHNYTHIRGTPKTIYILQVLSDDGGLNLATNSTYQDLFQQVRSDFIINITTIRAGDLSDVRSGTVTRKDKDGSNITVPYANLKEYLNTFDMLIIGFNDCYGELDRTAANAVVDFIHNPSGKSVLFTHDTTSFVNLPFNDYSTTGNSISYGNHWGYYFNSLLRDAVGLDRYGVTNPTFGVTRYSPLSDGASGIVAAGAVNAESAGALEAAGYSVAYKPRAGANPSSPKNTVGEVQGYTKYTLNRYVNNVDNGPKTTSRISQVNEGQITTYPFDLNLKGFGNTTNTATTMTIATTHDQYYQLNMNSDDIVVWYCLAGGDYDNNPNDVINAYYIYSVGNVTYSGSGHSGGTVVLSEAKLFVNTMIAAYQTSSTPPAVKIIDPSDPSGERELSDIFYVADDSDGSILAGSANSLADASIYFKVSDTSLGAGKIITASFTYDDGSSHEFTPEIYVKDGSLSPINMDTHKNPLPYSLSGGVTYYFKPPDELLNSLYEKGSVELTISVTSSLLPQQPASATATLHKFGLFPLD